MPSVLQTASDCGSLKVIELNVACAPYAVVAVAAAGAGDAASGAPGAFSSARRNATSVLALVGFCDPKHKSHIVHQHLTIPGTKEHGAAD